MPAGWDKGPTKSQGPNAGFSKSGKGNERSEGFRKFI